MTNITAKGLTTITPYLYVKEGNAAIEFYKKGFGAEVVNSMPGPDGVSVMHAELKIGGVKFYLAQEDPAHSSSSPETLGGCPSALYLLVENVDALFQSALAAGATTIEPVADMFWGDRYGRLVDPAGHQWSLATPIENLSREEIEQRVQEINTQQN